MSDAHHGGESDWDDQDLLTIDLANERLDEEIAALERLIAERGDDSPGSGVSPGSIDISDTRARLELLIEARSRLRQRQRAGS